MDTKHPEDVLAIFENEFLSGKQRQPHGEELVFFIKFLQQSI